MKAMKAAAAAAAAAAEAEFAELNEFCEGLTHENETLEAKNQDLVQMLGEQRLVNQMDSDCNYQRRNPRRSRNGAGDEEEITAARLKRSQKKLEEQQRSHEAALAKHTSDHEEALVQMQKEHGTARDAAVERLERDHRAEIRMLKEAHGSELSKLRGLSSATSSMGRSGEDHESCVARSTKQAEADRLAQVESRLDELMGEAAVAFMAVGEQDGDDHSIVREELVAAMHGEFGLFEKLDLDGDGTVVAYSCNVFMYFVYAHTSN